MLLSMIIVLGDTGDILDPELKDLCEHMYRMSLATHILCLIFKLITVWNRALSLKPMQVIDTVLVILHIWLMLVSVESFA